MWQHMWLPCLHTSGCSVGLSLGVEVLPATCSPCTPPASLGRNSSSCHTKEMLKLPLQLTEGGRRFSRGAKMQLQLSRIGFGEEHEPFLSVHTRPLDQSSVSCTSLSSGVLSSVCPCLSTIAILRPPSQTTFSLFSWQITTCRSWPANTTVSESSPHVRAGSRPSKISFPSITTTCSLPITEVKALVLFLVAPAEFCSFCASLNCSMWE